MAVKIARQGKAEEVGDGRIAISARPVLGASSAAAVGRPLF
jgi:hypothetical protein